MPTANENNFRDRSSEERRPGLSSRQFDISGQIEPNVISTRDLLEPIFMRTFYLGVMVPFLFSYLGSSNALVSLNEQARWLVGRLTLVWPILSAQFELVQKVRGLGHATSFGFMCGLLWVWPVTFAAASLHEHKKRSKNIAAVSVKEWLQFAVAFPFGIVFLVFDTTKITSPLFGFHADQHNVFYFRQWFVFSGTAIVLGVLLYAFGRAILARILVNSD
jgi:hypothetical protein